MMKNKLVRRLLLLGISVVIGLSIVATKFLPFAANSNGVAVAQTTALVGSWKLADYETRNSQGELLNEVPWHYDEGLLIYEKNGKMSVQLMNNNRPAFPKGDFVKELQKSKPEELTDAILGYLAYFGTYTITATSAGKGVVVHHVEASTNNYRGIDQKRAFELIGNKLVLSKLTTSAQTNKGELTSRIIWERL